MSDSGGAGRADISIARLGANYRKQEEPACACCGYTADWIIKVETLSRMFCEHHMVNAMLDAINFNTVVPASL